MRILFFLSQIILELLLLCSYPLLGLLARFLPKKQPVSDTDLPTIVIVKRWFSYHPLHRFQIAYLEKRGFRVIVQNFPFQKGTFRESAQALKRFMDEQDFKNVTMVGISNGGITVFLYLQELEGWERVHKFVAIGSPFRGTPLAYASFFLTSGRELWPNSSFIQTLLSQSIKHPHDILTMTAAFDEMVPVSSSILPGVQNKKINAIGHNRLHLATRKTYDTIINFCQA